MARKGKNNPYVPQVDKAIPEATHQPGSYHFYRFPVMASPLTFVVFPRSVHRPL